MKQQEWALPWQSPHRISVDAYHRFAVALHLRSCHEKCAISPRCENCVSPINLIHSVVKALYYPDGKTELPAKKNEKSQYRRQIGQQMGFLSVCIASSLTLLVSEMYLRQRFLNLLQFEQVVVVSFQKASIIGPFGSQLDWVGRGNKKSIMSAFDNSRHPRVQKRIAFCRRGRLRRESSQSTLNFEYPHQGKARLWLMRHDWSDLSLIRSHSVR